MNDAWLTGDALQALGRAPAAALARGWTKHDLAAWCPSFRNARTSHHALERLQQQGLVRRCPAPVEVRQEVRGGLLYFRLTDAGRAAVKAASETAVRTTRARNAVALALAKRGSSPFAQRLWTMLRIRQTLTSEDVAQLLTDAGGNFQATKDLAATYLRTWAQHLPDAIQVSAKRVQGCKRYVLVQDLGAAPPAVSIHRKGMPE